MAKKKNSIKINGKLTKQRCPVSSVDLLFGVAKLSEYPY